MPVMQPGPDDAADTTDTDDAADTARPAGVHLTRTGENAAAIDALAAHLADGGGGRVGVGALLDDLPRRARRTLAPHPRLLGRAVSRALTWDAADRRDHDWWPQGISTSVRTPVERDVLVVSWYAKHGQGSRLSFLDLGRRRYEHVLLVEPTLEDGRPGVRPLEVHAGGVVWHGPHVHVAATGRGFLTCRTDDVLRVPEGSALEAFGHRYVLPVRLGYRAAADDGVERLRYSFLSLDRSTDPPHLVAGEYGNRRQTRRFARFPTDDGTGLLAAGDDGTSRPLLDEGGETRMQGVAVAHGTWFVTSSRGPWTPGSVHVGRPGAFREHRWATPMGPEDLVFWPDTDQLWSVSEHPRRRWVFAMDRSRLDPGPRP